VPGSADGRAALFSAATPRRPGTLVVECGACRARARVGYADFARRSLPVAVWLPWRRHSRLLRCPACEQRTWVSARWFD
jgi:hypothetical protein